MASFGVGAIDKSVLPAVNLLTATTEKNQMRAADGVVRTEGTPSFGHPWLRTATGSRHASIPAGHPVHLLAAQLAAQAPQPTGVGWPGSAGQCAGSAAGSG